MSSFIFKKFEEPPNPDRLCNEDDRRLFFWDGEGDTGTQADNWGANTGKIDALFYQKLDDGGPGDEFNQVLSVDSQGRIVNYYTGTGSLNVKPDARGARAVDLQMFRVASSQVASGDGSALLGGACNTASGCRSAVVGGRTNTVSGQNSIIGSGVDNCVSSNTSGIIAGSGNRAEGLRSVVLGGFGNTTCTANADHSGILAGSNNQTSNSCSVVLGGSGLCATIANTAVAQNLQLQGGTANSSFFAVTTSTTAAPPSQATIQIRDTNSNINVSLSDPDGTTIVLRNPNIFVPGSVIFTNPIGNIVNRPGTHTGAIIPPETTITLPRGSSAILFKQGNNLVVISFYNPANYNSDGTLNP